MHWKNVLISRKLLVCLKVECDIRFKQTRKLIKVVNLKKIFLNDVIKFLLPSWLSDYMKSKPAANGLDQENHENSMSLASSTSDHQPAQPGYSISEHAVLNQEIQYQENPFEHRFYTNSFITRAGMDQSEVWSNIRDNHSSPEVSTSDQQPAQLGYSISGYVLPNQQIQYQLNPPELRSYKNSFITHAETVGADVCSSIQNNHGVPSCSSPSTMVSYNLSATNSKNRTPQSLDAHRRNLANTLLQFTIPSRDPHSEEMTNSDSDLTICRKRKSPENFFITAAKMRRIEKLKTSFMYYRKKVTAKPLNTTEIPVMSSLSKRIMEDCEKMDPPSV